MNGNGNGEGEYEPGAEWVVIPGEEEAGAVPQMWEAHYPQDMNERLAWFHKLQQDTAQEVINLDPYQRTKWNNILLGWGVSAFLSRKEFLYHCFTIQRERIFPMFELWPALYQIQLDDIYAYHEVYLHLMGQHTRRIIDIIEQAFDVHDYELELKIDEIIAEIGKDFGVADWVQNNLNEAYDRSKRKARIGTIVAVIAVAILTYGISETLGISGKVSTAVAEAKAVYVQGTLWDKILGWVKVITAGFKAFLDAIHYRTLVALHKVAYLVSSDYREIMQDVYGQLSKASSALGLGPHYLQLFYQSARVLILDVSTSLGRGYDVAQLEWLSTFNGYLKVFNSRASRYKSDPSLLFYDLEQLVERPALDAKGAGTAAVFNTLDSLLTSTEDTIKNIHKINTDVEQLVSNLPESIKEHVKPYTDKVTKKVDEFIENSYDPAMATLNGLIIAIKGVQETTKGALSGVISRIAKPANYLLEIDSMDDLDRLDQENKLAGVTSRGYIQDSNFVAGETLGEYVHLEAIAAALREVTISPVIFPYEIDLPQRSAIEPATPRETWFIGEF